MSDRHPMAIMVHPDIYAMMREENDRRSRKPNAPVWMILDRIARDAEIAMYRFSQDRVGSP